MAMSRRILYAIVLWFAATPVLSANSVSLPGVRVLATGGTIAGMQSTLGTSSYKAGAMSVGDLIKTIPQVDKIAEVSAEEICNIGSQTMTDGIWLTLARRVTEVLRDPKIAGVVITHGTDTMEETAYFLSLVIKSEKPVVMVGAMRPANALGADGPANLYDAIALAANPEAAGRGVLVVLNDEIYYAREVQKNNTTLVNAFGSRNRGLAGVVQNGKATFFALPVYRFGARSEFSLDGVKRLPPVEIVYSHASLGRGMIDYLVNVGVKGIVLAGTGEGNTTDEALAALQDAADKGVVVVRSTRVARGSVRRNIEVNDDKLGFIASEELNPQKARVLLMLGLLKTTDRGILQRYIEEY